MTETRHADQTRNISRMVINGCELSESWQRRLKEEAQRRQEAYDRWQQSRKSRLHTGLAMIALAVIGAILALVY